MLRRRGFCFWEVTMSKGMRTEDEVRDSAKLVLGFDKTEDGVQQGTGQITTFNQLGFRGCNDKPDGWYGEH